MLTFQCISTVSCVLKPVSKLEEKLLFIVHIGISHVTNFNTPVSAYMIILSEPVETAGETRSLLLKSK